ncbi:hypothetical protein, partial [Hymenobacter glacialis]|uniref:hypothetical protein n=1 Tax=Hymenobacter glacialis TaxID=1908236 RepID=UPI0019D3FA6C
MLNFLAIALFQIASICSSAPQESTAIGSGGWGNDVAAIGSGGWGNDVAAIGSGGWGNDVAAIGSG